MGWRSIKQHPVGKRQVLCAWQPFREDGEWQYEVLIHWPDGVWTDKAENEVQAEEMPTYWWSILEPARRAEGSERCS